MPGAIQSQIYAEKDSIQIILDGVYWTVVFPGAHECRAQAFCTTSLLTSYGLALTSTYLIRIVHQKYKTNSAAHLL